MRRRRSTTTVALMALDLRDADDAGLVHAHCAGGVRRTFATPEDAVGARSRPSKPETPEEVVAHLRTRRKRSSPTPLIARNRPSKSRRVHGRGRREVAARSTREASARCSSSATKDGRFPFHWRRTRADGGSTPPRERGSPRQTNGRNELAVIQICRTYVAAQRLYAKRGHDGQAAGLYARTFRSDPGRENGLYWPLKRGQERSPLGDLVANAAAEGRPLGKEGPQPSPFHGYYFKILTAQGSAAAGGAKDYVVDGRMSGGFALVAWPAQYTSPVS